MESRIPREGYVRFGREYLETYCRNTKRRWVLTLRK
ncbi:TraG family conjugative transposon ATPase, partial [Bacillus toyonensis]